MSPTPTSASAGTLLGRVSDAARTRAAPLSRRSALVTAWLLWARAEQACGLAATPVWVAGYGPKALELTGRCADGFILQLADPDITRWTVAKVREAEAFPVLKIKVGLDTDEQTIAAVRSVTDKPLRVDANEGWSPESEWLHSARKRPPSSSSQR